MSTPNSSFTIGVVAKRVGVAIDTIRYYEREGLLPEPMRRASGYRSYGEGAIAQLRFIRRAKRALPPGRGARRGSGLTGVSRHPGRSARAACSSDSVARAGRFVCRIVRRIAIQSVANREEI